MARKKIDWWKVIERAAAKKKARLGGDLFTDAQRNAAMNWPDCACGVQDKRIPRSYLGDPEDDILAALGGEFSDAVLGNNPSKAASLLKKIEKRSAILLEAFYLSEQVDKFKEKHDIEY